MEELTPVHPILKKLFSEQKIPKYVLAGRIKEFLPAWKLLTKDQELSPLLEGYQIPILMEPLNEQSRTTKTSRSGSESNAGKRLHFQRLSL